MHPMVPEWNDFLQFAMDVGERPSPKHKLYSADEAKPIGPGNFVWKEAFTQRVDGEDDRTFLNRRGRAYRAVRQEAFQGYSLKKMYGLSREQYIEMWEAQDGKCAICGQPETAVIRGKTLMLAVDHCHATGRIRGLCCSAHNTALGLFGDDPTLLRAAAAYLERTALAAVA